MSFPQWRPNKRKEKEKAKETNKGKEQKKSTLYGGFKPPPSFSLSSPSSSGGSHATDPGISQEIQGRLRCPFVPKQPDRGGPWVFPPASFHISLHNLLIRGLHARYLVKRWWLPAIAPQRPARVGLFHLLVEVGPCRRMPRQEK